MNDGSHEVGLVSCVKTKRDDPASPKDLYTSPYFAKMRTYAEREHDDWWILSAKHGLLAPNGDPIAPYDETLTTASVDERRAWAEDVMDDLDAEGVLADADRLVLHAGKAYYGELQPLLDECDVQTEIPTVGLAFGETQAWYNERL